MLKAFHDAGLEKTTRILAIGGVVDDDSLPALGDAALDVISSYYYSPNHDSALNRLFVKDFKAIDGADRIPDFAAIGAYDALAAIYRIVNDQKGGTDPDKAMATMRGYKAESPRGPITIDPTTRDIVQNVYIRRVERKNGVLQNTEIATYPMVKDPTENRRRLIHDREDMGPTRLIPVRCSVIAAGMMIVSLGRRLAPACHRTIRSSKARRPCNY